MILDKGLFLLAFCGFMGTSLAGTHGYGQTKPRNFIMVIPDGFGPASETMARDFIHWKNNATTGLPIDFLQIGGIRTKSSDSYVPDSASTATAYSCGIKTLNGAIGVNDDNEPCGTVLEAAKAKGFLTGLVVTSRITHATPASYIAHVWDRDDEANIALQEIGLTHPFGRQVDILLGGGRCFFQPKTILGSCRKDDIDALDAAKKLGYSVFTDRKGFDQKQHLPYLGLFTQDHMSYEIDRDPKKEPSLTEMALKALDDLYQASKKNEKGFFIMVEASRIDHAGHANDPVGHLYDILEYNNAMKEITRWIRRHQDSPTVMISTADHECGGLSLGYQLDGRPDYWWEPSFFENTANTYGVLAAEWKAYTGGNQEQFLRNIFARYGVEKPTAKEIADGLQNKANATVFGDVLSKALNSRLGVNWATKGHSGVDVTLYGYGINYEQMIGNHENTEIAVFVRKQLDLDLESITKKIRANKTFVQKYVLPPKSKSRRDLDSRRALPQHHH